MELRGRVALVTGAGRRLGRAIALGLAREGARVAVHHHTASDGARAVVDEIRRLGGDAKTFAADLTDPVAAGSLVAAVAAAWDGLDVVVNSAGVMHRTPIGAVTPAEWDAIFAINLRAPFFIAQAAAPLLCEPKRRGEGGREGEGEGEGGGAIVNIADLAGLETWSAYVPHGISKSGVIQMTRALAHALAPRVRVNAVAPGAVLLPEDWDAAAAEHLVSTTPLRRLGTPEDVVDAVIYLLRADYVTGTTLVVDGGRRVRV